MMSFWDKIKKILFGEAPPPKAINAVGPSSEPAATPNANVAPPPPSDGTYRRVIIERGARGWGGPLTVAPKPGKDLIYCVTGDGIHPIATHIAELTGGRPFDGFKSKADFEQIAVAVIDCGGTARIGVYPMKGVLTVDVHGASPSGPLMKYITADLFVSGVTVDTIKLVE